MENCGNYSFSLLFLIGLTCQSGYCGDLCYFSALHESFFPNIFTSVAYNNVHAIKLLACVCMENCGSYSSAHLFNLSIEVTALGICSFSKFHVSFFEIFVLLYLWFKISLCGQHWQNILFCLSGHTEQPKIDEIPCLGNVTPP